MDENWDSSTIRKAGRWALIVFATPAGLLGGLMFVAVALNAFTSPLWEPTLAPFLALGGGAVLALSAALAAYQRRTRAARLLALVGALLVAALVAASYEVGSKPCDRLEQLEDQCLSSHDCQAYESYRDELLRAICAQNPRRCQEYGHFEPEIRRENINFVEACVPESERPCPHRGRVRCASPHRMEVCELPAGWRGEDCEGRCSEESLIGWSLPGCQVAF